MGTGCDGVLAMMKLLVVEDEALFRLVIQRMLRGQENLILLEAHGVAEATAFLRQGGVNVLLTDLRLEDGDGLDLIGALPELSPETVPILMSGVATGRDHQSAMRLGAVEVLTKPFTTASLLGAVQRALDSTTGFRGSVHGLSLTDLLQLIHLAARSLVLELRGARGEGMVVFHEGEIVHAAMGTSIGIEAMQGLLSMHSGTLHTVPYRPTERTIEGSFQEILMDSFREMDEQSQASPQLSLSTPPPSSNSLALMTYVSQLDPELGVAFLHAGRVEPLAPGRLSPERWQRLGELGRDLTARAGEGWNQIQWIVKNFGMTLLRLTSGELILLGQRFIDKLDDRRFRWNVARVERFLREEPGAIPAVTHV
jgi:CheY-like chemotaxis protein